MKQKLQLLTCITALAWWITANAQETNQLHTDYTNAPSLTGSTNATVDADNTARNARDRNSGTRTPLDQGNSKEDLNTSAQIRKGILADKSMSINAQNVKIITANGRVVLRGPVNTPEEKRRVCDIAKNIAGLQNVVDQLEIATRTN